MMNSFRTLVLQLRIFTPCATEPHVGTVPKLDAWKPVALLHDAGSLPGRAQVDSGVGRDPPHDRCGQDEQHCIDHNPVGNHVATSFNL
jgi:hypothetical protein